MQLAPEAIERLRRQLLQRRYVLVESSVQNQRELAALKEQGRSAEMEEGAQSAAAEYVITHLSDTQRREVQQIDDALSRMESGTYGICVDCEAAISEARLRAVPFAIRDAGCASKAEVDELGAKELPSL